MGLGRWFNAMPQVWAAPRSVRREACFAKKKHLNVEAGGAHLGPLGDYRSDRPSKVRRNFLNS